MIEIRWHGRGGQGAKTVALLLGEACMQAGKFVQAFPEYGPERSGAPVQSFNRIDDKPIRQHSPVSSPDVVVVLDPTLIGKINVVEGLKETGVLIVNTPLAPSALRKKLGLKGFNINTVDASKISVETIGRDIPNTPMLGALIKATKLIDFKNLVEDTRHKLELKFKSKPEVIDGNIKAIERAYQEAESDNASSARPKRLQLSAVS